MRLHYREHGDGPPVIVLHGLFGTGDNWTGIARALSQRFRVILADAPNHGDSPWTDSMDFRSQASAVASFIESLNPGTVRIVGHSMGGKTGMALALVRPDLVEKLVVVDIAPKQYAPSHIEILEAMRLLSEARPDSRREADSLLSEYGVREPMVRAFLLKSYRTQDTEKSGWKLNLDVIRREYDEIVGWPDFGNAVFDGPVGVVYGGKSSYVSPDDELLFTRHFPSTAFRRIDGAGHWVHAEKPQEITAALFEMLQ